MRGRISSVNSIFISMSNELGTFESGFLASLVGPVVAVWAGGIGTLLVVLVVAFAFPDLRRLGSLEPGRITPRGVDDGAIKLGSGPHR